MVTSRAHLPPVSSPVLAPYGENSAAASWAVVLPVKMLAQAKSRLADAAGGHREWLALAVAVDTVTAALACPRVRSAVVVTDDPVAGPELEEAGARVVPDEPGAGLNAALRYGATRAGAASPETGVAALSADLPALRPGELARGLDAAAGHAVAFVPDAAGSGTTLYAAAPGVAMAPEFGPGSRRRHAAAGGHELALPGIESVRCDVDTPADLERAAWLGLGTRTAEVTRLLRRASG